MYVEGIVTELDLDNYKVKLLVEELDNFETPWLSVGQPWTVFKKTGYMPEKNALVGAMLSDDMTHGMVIGCIYNDKDSVIAENKTLDFIQFEDGASFKHAPASNAFDLTVQNLNVLGNINTVGDVNVDGDLNSTGDIKDKKGTMQEIRDTHNRHKHPNGNNGADTGTPTSTM